MRWWLWTAILLGALGIGWWLTRSEPVIDVRLAIADRGDVELTVSNTRAGSVKACRRSGLSMPIGGRVEALHVDEGDAVEAGDLLLELWNDDREALVEQARAQLDVSQHRREQFCVESVNAGREAGRMDSMFARGLASVDQRDGARTRASATAFSCEAARNEEDVARAALSLNTALLEETRLKAPFAGVVAEITGELGEYVTPSPPGVATPPAVDLIDYSCLYVTAPIDEVDAARLSVGQPARIALDAFRGEYFDGELVRIAPYVLEIEKQARTVEVDVVFAHAADRERLLVGYSADIDVVLDVHANAVRIPTEAVLEGDRVWRVDDNDRLQRVDVEPGLRNWDFTEIRAGLQAGDRIVLSLDVEGIAEGVAVAVVDDPT